MRLTTSEFAALHAMDSIQPDHAAAFTHDEMRYACARLVGLGLAKRHMHNTNWMTIEVYAITPEGRAEMARHGKVSA